MIFDIHVHMAGLSPAPMGKHSQPLARHSLMLRLFAKRLGSASGEDQIRGSFLSWAETSRIDRMVVLALDSARHPNGSPDWNNTILSSTNHEVAALVSMHHKLLFGASIHPARPDAIEELERVVKQGACLIKWIPSAQNIRPDDPACIPFYEAMAHHNVPLLSHTGNEHTLRRFHNNLNDPRRLIAALNRGVTVIGAHCGTRLMLHEKSYFAPWKQMALNHEHFFGDLSAFSLPLHRGPLTEILKNQQLLSKVLYGSDFPAFTMPLWHLPQLGIAGALKLRSIRNPLDQAHCTMKALGVPDEVFARAQAILKLPQVNISANSGNGRLVNT